MYFLLAENKHLLYISDSITEIEEEKKTSLYQLLDILKFGHVGHVTLTYRMSALQYILWFENAIHWYLFCSLIQEEGANSGPDRLFKIVMVGNSSVGKTSLLRRFCDDCFYPGTSATVGQFSP